MFDIERVKTSDQRFTEVAERLSVILDEYFDYSNNQSQISGKVNVSSNKASSYRNYLIRLIISYEKNNNDLIDELETKASFEKINSVKKKTGFKEFNTKSNNFYSATLNEFGRFLKDREETIEIEVENEIENRVNEEILENENKNIQVNKELLIITSSPKKEKIEYKTRYINPRNINEAQFAKEKANWKCEVNEEHNTFIAKSGNPYVETHHLIPMFAQKEYENTIDFADNLVALCPNCHQLVHRAVNEEKVPILRKLFEDRKSNYSKYGIEITFKKLMKYYT